MPPQATSTTVPRAVAPPRKAADLKKLIEAVRRVERILGRTLPGQVIKAGPRLTRLVMDAVATASG